jgi:hypothetical protein
MFFETTFALFEIWTSELLSSHAAVEFGDEKFSGILTSVFDRRGMRKQVLWIMVELFGTNCHKLATTRKT